MRQPARPLLRVTALLFFLWQNVALYLWIRAAGGVRPALAHLWAALHADWMLALILTDAGMFTLLALWWLWRDLRRRGLAPAPRAVWFGACCLIGSAVMLVYLSLRESPASHTVSHET